MGCQADSPCIAPGQSEQRARIWRGLCPPELPLSDDVDFARLAKKFELTGGLIKNAFVRAAYRAAQLEGQLTQELLREACHAEYTAAGKVTRNLQR